MGTNRSNPIIVIGGSGYDASAMSDIFDQVSSWCNSIIEKFAPVTGDSSAVTVRFRIAYEMIDEYQDINAYASRDRTGEADYEVCLYASLIYNLWLLSRLPTAYNEAFEEIIKKIHSPLDTDAYEYLASIIFFLSVVTVLAHELAHIYLGHVDWRSEKLQKSKLVEIADPCGTDEFLAATFAMEAEADALAASLLLTVASTSCFEDGTFKSLGSALWTLAFAATLTIYLFENKILFNGPPTVRSHPTPPERWFMFNAHLAPNVSKLYKGAHFEQALFDGALTGFNLTGLGNLHNQFEPIAHARSMSQIESRLQQLDLYRFRLYFMAKGRKVKVQVA